MLRRLKTRINNYLNSNKLYPTVIAVASGFYPMLYCYSGNFSLHNSAQHLLFFLLVFIGTPILVFNGVNWLLSLFNLKNHGLFIFSLLNVFISLYFIKIIMYSGLHLKKTILLITISILFSVFLKRHLKKLVIIQYVMALISLIGLLFSIYSNLIISNDWQSQPDTISGVSFKKAPNVYYIQPDGYVNFKELKRGFYDYDNSAFESYLDKNGFTSYPDFRTNYSSTLSSNSSIFTMKHHYYNNRVSDFELYNARDMIISKNPVLDIFKNNGYKTYYISETDYMLYNRPKMGYDYCNINYNDFSFIKPGIKEPINIRATIEQTVSETIDQPKFFFIQMLSPWHIKSKKRYSSNDKDTEKRIWIENLAKANYKLTEAINLIKQKDPNALIIIMADHGGYVGFEYGDESDIMTDNRDLIYSIFSSKLSIHWPNNDTPIFDDKFKTSVNMFRLVFSYLSEDEKYINKLESDISYKVLREGVDVGIYKYIDEEGNITLEAHK